MKRKLIFIIFWLISASLSVAPAENSPVPPQNQSSSSPPEAKQAQEWQFNPGGPIIRTSLAALILNGRWRSDQVYLSDFDILITDDNKRLIPFLRLLRTLMATGTIDDSAVVFKVDPFPEATINIKYKSVTVNNETHNVEMEIGVSDVTHAGEIYISEDIVKIVFGAEAVWSDADFGYTVKIDKELEIFKQKWAHLNSLLNADVQNISEILPETEPPAYPEKEKHLLSFFQTDMRSDAFRSWTDTYRSQRYSVTPGLTFWGSVLNGDYEVDVRNSIVYPNTTVSGFTSWLDRGIWTSKRDDLLVNLGDTNLGLSDLIVPSTNLFGATVKWFPQSAQQALVRDKFFTSRRASFLSVGVFEGYAPFNSTVDLWINNRLVESKPVDKTDEKTPPGYGYYKFEGVNLLDNSVNQIKFVVKRPDGITEEYHKEVLGASQIMPQGQWAFTSGAGTHRHVINGNTTAKGRFIGGQALYGLADDITLGVTTALQDKFAIIEDEFFNSYDAPTRYYIAPEVRAQFLNHFFTKGNFGVSYDPANNSSAFASLLNVEYYLNRLKLKSQIFAYDPNYSNGVTSVSDKRGYNLSGTLKLFKNWLAKGGFLQIGNNTDGHLSNTTRENFLTASLTVPGLLPRSTVQLQGAHLEGDQNDFFTATTNWTKGTMYTVELESRLTRKFQLEGYYTCGDRLDLSMLDDLKTGVPVSDITYLYSYGKRIKASYQLSNAHAISATYWDSLGERRVELSSYYNHLGRVNWRSRFDLDKDVVTSDLSFKEYLDFDLNERGSSRWGINVGFNQDRNNLEVGLYVTLRDLFFVDKGRISHIPSSGITPKRGGIQGIVYMDLNGNGHRDNKEPGLEHMKILVDGREAAETDKKGNFYIARSERFEMVTVSLDAKSLPTIYNVTQGVQKAHWKEGAFTRVSLGVCVVSSLSGTVKVKESDTEMKNVPGATVLLLGEDGKTIVKDSVTAVDGSFYFGEIKPGKYTIKVEPQSIPDTYELDGDLAPVVIPSGTKPVEVENYEINFKKIQKIEEVPPAAPEAVPAQAAKQVSQIDTDKEQHSSGPISRVFQKIKSFLHRSR